jgi:hypothetical protein
MGQKQRLFNRDKSKRLGVYRYSMLPEACRMRASRQFQIGMSRLTQLNAAMPQFATVVLEPVGRGMGRGEQ